MDFADILEAWEKRGGGQETSDRQKKRCNRKPDDLQQDQHIQPRRQGVEARVNPMDFWMRRYGVFDKDAAAERNDEKRKLLSTAELKKLPAEAVLDLHGLTRDEAWLRLNAFISECSLRRLKKVLIVHGKGNHSEEAPVLKALVHSFIEWDTRLGASGHPAGADGGSGATWVIIRTNLL